MMKLSYTYATPETRSSKMLAYRGEIEKTFRRLGSMGYRGIEFMVRDVKELDIRELQRNLDDTGLTLCAVSTGQLRAEDGLNLSDLNEQSRKDAVIRTKEVISFAAEFGVQVNIGTLRGRLPEAREAGKQQAVTSLTELLDHALNCGIYVALEPQNRYTINWLNSISESLEFCGQFHHPNLKLVFDVYHWLLEEQSIYASLINAWDKITHIQFSDSNRSIPGTGQINFVELVRVLQALRYDGFVSIEAIQSPSSAEVAKKSAQYLLPLFHEKSPLE